jgi:NADH:ubiquinone oxidoreductase subunit C
MEPAEVGERLTAKFADQVHGIDAFPGTLGKVRFDPAIALALFREVKDGLGFQHLSMVAGIDRGTTRDILYVAWSDAAKQYLLLVTSVPADQAHVESATPVWPSANWHEREAWEMVGIDFDHHPDLRHLLMPDGYAFHPLLRSFKLHEPEELEVKTRDV